MIRYAHYAVTIVAMFLACFGAEAQTRGGGPAAMPARLAPAPMASSARASGPSAAPVPPGAHASRQARVIQISPSGRSISGPDGFADSHSFSEEGSVPGLGFDYVHLAAVSGNFRNNPPGIGSGERHRRNLITPVFLGGYPYYSDASDYQPEQPQPQIIVIQQPVPAAPVHDSAPPAQETRTDAAPPTATAAPVREVGEFILVRRDGRILFTSVFSVSGTQVQYVTPEGIRRTLPLDQLDTGATEEMNEARGTTLQFPN
jgi:hypothetical protein